jgi:hypothetical protein
MGRHVSGGLQSKATAINALSSTPTPILANGGEVMILLAGRPDDPSYVEDLKGLDSNVGSSFTFRGKLKKHRRGTYRSVSTGITLGGGSMVSGKGSARHFRWLTTPGRLQGPSGYRRTEDKRQNACSTTTACDVSQAL